MSRRRRNRLLVPEAGAALERLKFEVMHEQGKVTAALPRDPSVTPTIQSGPTASYGGNLTTKQAGEMGGTIGGGMVKRLISIAEQELQRQHQTNERGTP